MVKLGLKYLIFSLCLSSCAYVSGISKAPKEIPPENKNEFRLKDESGEYSLIREAGPGSENKTFVVKRKLKTFGKEKSKTLEKSISISFKENKELIPKISQFSVWYNKKKHFSQIELKREENQLKVTWESPDPKYNGIKYYPLKSEKENHCFYSQIIECARQLNFLRKAGEDQEGKLKLKIIWDGHPFFQQQFVNFNTAIISSAVLEYDGKNRKGQKRFSLKVEGESIYYFVDKKDRMMGQYWISKGLTVERLKSKTN